ncbi:MAG: DUF3887 domain-containing protein [Roseburia sp.]
MTVKSYTRKVAKYLLCRPEVKKEMRKQIESDIASAMEQGKSLEEVLSEMGNPKELAEEFNENFEEKEKETIHKKKHRKTVVTIVVSIFIVIAVLVGITYWMLPKSKDIGESAIFSEEEVIESAEEVIFYLDAEQYEKLDSYMTHELKEALGENGLKQAKESIGEDFGAFQCYKNTYAVEINQKGQKFAMVQLDVSYENISITYTVTFDEEMKLAGIYMR